MAEIRHLTNGIDVIVFGEGPRPFVIIPGMSVAQLVQSAVLIENAFKESFSKAFTMYLMDAREDMYEGYRIEDMARDCADAMKELGVSHACVFGASQGGMIAQVLAAKYPELIDKVIIGSAAYHNNDVSRDTFTAWIRLSNAGDIVEANRGIFRRIHSPQKLKDNADAFRVLEREGSVKEFAHYAVMARACLEFDGTDYLEALSKIKDRILVIGDKTDNVFTGDASVELAEKIGCELFMYDGYGHTVYDSAPDYQSRMKEFFERT